MNEVKDAKPSMGVFHQSKTAGYARSGKLYKSHTLYRKHQLYYGNYPIEGIAPEMTMIVDTKPKMQKVKNL